jgi:hypothetical protein
MWAADMTAQSWPLRLDRKDRLGETKAAKRERFLKEAGKEKAIFPFLGLSQANSTIRAEFRPWWMSGHCTTLSQLNGYLAVFWRHPPLKDRVRFEAYFNPACKLRIMVRDTDLLNGDLLRLVKLKRKHPDLEVVFERTPLVQEAQIEGLARFVNNSTPKWLKLIRASGITSIIVWKYRFGGLNPPYQVQFRLTFKEKYSENWMKPPFGVIAPEKFLEDFGLNGLLLQCRVNYT